MQGKEHVRTPFGRIYEWLDMAEKFTFDDEEVTASGLAGLCIRCFPASRCCNDFELLKSLLTGPSTGLQKQKKFAAFDFAVMRSEVQAVEAAATAVRSPVVFAHNDLLSGGFSAWRAAGRLKQRTCCLHTVACCLRSLQLQSHNCAPGCRQRHGAHRGRCGRRCDPNDVH